MRPPSFFKTLHASAQMLVLFCSSVNAGRAVMDFDSQPGGALQSPYTEDGLRAECLYSDNSHAAWQVITSGQGNTGHKAIRTNNAGSTTNRVTAENGRPFTLVSLRLSPYVLQANITFTGRKPNATTVTQVFSTGTDAAGTVRTFSGDFQDIVSFEWNATTAMSTQCSVDDITVNLPARIMVTPAVTVTEGAGAVSLGVSFDEPLLNPLSLTWQALAGTAAYPADYTFGAGTTATVTVPAGATAWMLPCTIAADSVSESMESFVVGFSTTSLQAYFPDNILTSIRIGNDDGVTSFSGWVTGHGLAGPDALADADPDGDGITNIEAWLFRLNPAGPSPAAWRERRATFLFDASSRPAIRITVPAPLPSDVRMIFEENSGLSGIWNEQARRSGFGVGSLWTGSGSARVTETTSGTGSRTVTCSGSQTLRQRPRAFLRMKYALVSGGSN